MFPMLRSRLPSTWLRVFRRRDGTDLSQPLVAHPAKRLRTAQPIQFCVLGSPHVLSLTAFYYLASPFASRARNIYVPICLRSCDGCKPNCLMKLQCKHQLEIRSAREVVKYLKLRRPQCIGTTER
jgi:hypothetical protein